MTSCSAPVNINVDNITGTTDKRDEYRYDYNTSSNIVLKNYGSYASFSYESSSVPQVKCAGSDYTVSEIRLYIPSLHKWGGIRAAAEVIIKHTSSDGKNLLVCIPVRSTGATTLTTRFFESVNSHLKLINDDEQNTDRTIGMGSVSLNLNNWIPQKRYYAYTASDPFSSSSCSQNYKYVVFDIDDAIKILEGTLNSIKSKYISPSGINTTNASIDVAVSEKDARQGLDGSFDTDDIYIDCRPIYESDQTSPFGPGTEQKKVPSNFLDKITEMFATNDILNHPIVIVIFSILLMTAIYNLGTYVFRGYETAMKFKIQKQAQMKMSK